MKWIVIIALAAGAWWCYDTGVFQTVGSKAAGSYQNSVKQNQELM